MLIQLAMVVAVELKRWDLRGVEVSGLLQAKTMPYGQGTLPSAGQGSCEVRRAERRWWVAKATS